MIRGFQLVCDAIRWALEQDMPVAIAADLSDRIVRNKVNRMLDKLEAGVKVKKVESELVVEDVYDWYFGEYTILLLPTSQLERLADFKFGNYFVCNLRAKRLTYTIDDDVERHVNDVIYPAFEIR